MHEWLYMRRRHTLVLTANVVVTRLTSTATIVQTASGASDCRSACQPAGRSNCGTDPGGSARIRARANATRATAAASHGSTRSQGNGMGAGASVDSRTAFITRSVKPDDGT